MEAAMIEFQLRTSAREVFLDITAQVQAAVDRERPGHDGLVHVFVPHTTAGITINEGADPAVAKDILAALGRIVPRSAGYLHGEGNSDAHIKATLVGSSVTVPVGGGRLRLGTWQSLYFAEFDGPRSRRVWVEFSS
jgi:secondary thiamine-phosphate synthase enzyme